MLFLPVLNHPLPLELFVYLRLIIGILSLRTSAHLTVLPLSNPALNLTFSLLPLTLKEDLDTLGVDWSDARDYDTANDRARWRQLVAQCSAQNGRNYKSK